MTLERGLGERKPAPETARLAGDEGVERALALLRAHARPVVGDLDHDLAARPAGRHPDPAGPGQRLDGIGEDTVDDLGRQHRVHPHRRQRLLDRPVERDAVALEERGEFGEAALEQGAGLALAVGLAARGRQIVPDPARESVGLRGDVTQQLFDLRPLAPLDREFGGGADRGQGLRSPWATAEAISPATASRSAATSAACCWRITAAARQTSATRPS